MNRHSMITTAALVALLLLAPAAGSAQEPAPRYRVELIVFRHLDGHVAPAEMDQLHGFERAFDPLHDELPDELVALPELTPAVQAVWDRLARSAGYRPLAWAAWEQDSLAFSPPIRVHGEDRLRDGETPVEGLEPARCSDVIEAGADPAPLVDGQELPPCEPGSGPRVHYVLDGQAQLRRSRFLHLDVHVVHRQPAGTALPQGEIDPATGAARLLEAEPLDANPPRWRVIELRQSRQVRPDEYHYFDGPVYGAIARVSEVEPEPEAISEPGPDA